MATTPTYETHAARRTALLEELDAFYASLETTDRDRFPSFDMVLAMDRELIEELGRVTYEMHRLHADV